LVFQMKTRALLLSAVVGVLAAGCASAPPAPPVPVVTAEEKLGWILRLEDRRILAVAPIAAPTVMAPAPAQRRAAVAPAFIATPDLAVLARDPEARIRRRAALAIGRVGLVEGLPAILPLLQDPQEEVRAMAAFGLGLIASGDAVAPLTAALADLSPRVRGRAAEALGTLCAPAPGADGAPTCDAGTAPAIAAMAEAYVAQAAAMAGDAETADTPEADAWRLAAFALVRLRDWSALSRVVLASGRPVTTWWPAAFALQRIGNAGAVPALRELARTGTVTAAAFAMRGLADQRDAASRRLFVETASDHGKDVRLRVTAVRALGRLSGPESAKTLIDVLMTPELDDNLRLETVTALAAAGDASAVPPLLDLLADDWPVLRAAALGAVARLEPDNFTLVLSGLPPDADWTVRAATARLLSALPAETAAERLTDLWHDEDRRVHGAALEAAVAARLPQVEGWIKEALASTDSGERTAAASAIGRLKPTWGPDALRAAYQAWASDPDYSARAAALDALAGYGADAARETLTAALADRDWAVRVHARGMLAGAGAEGATPASIRPVPNAWPEATYTVPSIIAPAYSPHVFLDTRHGTIEIELDVIAAPLTSWNFLELARKGFYNGIAFHRVVPNFVAQAGDPRGDGEGGPGRSIRDELHPAPYLRGSVGMALSWADTGGSQFFIAHGPAPHLDGRYTLFGKVVSGMEVVDKIRQGDVITAVRVRDGSN
jgi:cyclophilin family peptidyl-prolyl cis-trans isomerase/HEAT repeat protein